MKNKCLLLLGLAFLSTWGLHAQEMKDLAFYQEAIPTHQPKAAKKSLFVKTGWSNLINPNAPSFDMGLEFAVERLGVELLYGLQTPLLLGEVGTEIERPFDSHHKIFLSLRYFDTDRIKTAALVPLVYIAGETFFSWGKDTRIDDYVIDTDFSRINFSSALYKKNMWGINIKGGVIFPITHRLEVEAIAGIGYLNVKRDYTFFSSQPPIQNINYEPAPFWSFGDRALGRHSLPNVILNGKLNVRIF